MVGPREAESGRLPLGWLPRGLLETSDAQTQGFPEDTDAGMFLSASWETGHERQWGQRMLWAGDLRGTQTVSRGVEELRGGQLARSPHCSLREGEPPSPASPPGASPLYVSLQVPQPGWPLCEAVSVAHVPQEPPFWHQ